MIAAILLGLFARQNSGQFMGARSILHSAEAAPPTPASVTAKVTFAKQVDAFAQAEAAMAPHKAATEWLKLVNKAFQMNDGGVQYSQREEFGHVFSALPSPESWPIIESLVKSGALSSAVRRDCLLLLLDILQGKTSSAKTLYLKLKRQDSGIGNVWYLRDIGIALADRGHDPAMLESILLEEADENSSKPRYGMRGAGPAISMPDVVRMLGPKRARTLLTTVLLKAKAELTFMGGGQSEDLARKITIENAERVAWPQWTLAASPDAGNLFEIFRRRFPEVTLGITDSNPPSGSTLGDAAMTRFYVLVSKGDLASAKKLVEEHAGYLSRGILYDRDPSDLKPMEGKQRDDLLSFLLEIAKRGQSWSCISLYITLAKSDGSPSDAIERLKRLRSVCTQDAQLNYVVQNLDSDLESLYLKEGNLQAALALEEKSSGGNVDFMNGPSDRLYRIASLLNRQDLLKKALDGTVSSYGGIFFEPLDEIETALLQHGYGSKIEHKLIEELAKRESGQSSPPAKQIGAAKLAGFYFEVGRYQDVVTMFERFPMWSATDVMDINSSFGGHTGPYILAFSLNQVGRAREALHLLSGTLKKEQYSDEELDLLASIGTNAALNLLEDASRAHPGAPRYRVCKAKILMRLGMKAAAIRAVEQAIALDPNDNEHWRSPDRFRAYVLLAKLNGSKGGEKFALCGDLSNRASQLDQMNFYVQAEELYRKELAMMPNDFRARLALGLMLVDGGKRKQGMAEIQEACKMIPSRWSDDNYFGTMAAIQPKRRRLVEAAIRTAIGAGHVTAGAYAMLGSLESLSGNRSSAVADYKRAVSLDRGYLSAWNRLATLGEGLEPSYRAKVIANLQRLGVDHPDLSSSSTANYASIWRKAQANSGGRIKFSPPGFVLRASKSAIDRGKDPDYMNNLNSGNRPDTVETPGSVIAREDLILKINIMIDNSPKG